MSTEHKRPLLAFAAVFVVAMLVVAGAARSDALRHLVQERTVDMVAATTLGLVEETEQGPTATEPEAEASGTQPVSSPAKGKAVKGKAVKDRAVGRAQGHAHAKAPGRAKGHAHAKAPGRAKGHAHAKPRAKAKGHGQGATTGPGKGKGHAKGKGKGHGKHGH